MALNIILKTACCCISLFISCLVSFSQISYDSNATAAGSVSSTTSETLSSFTVPTGTDRILIVTISAQTTTSGVTYNSTALTQAVTAVNGVHNSEIWYLLLGDGGAVTSDIVVSFGSAAYAVVGASSYDGVLQGLPVGSTRTTTGTGTSPSLSFETSTATNLLVSNIDMLYDGSTAPTSVPGGTGQTELYETSHGFEGTGAASYMPATGGTDAMSWTLSHSSSYAIAAIELNDVDACNQLPNLAQTQMLDGATSVTISDQVICSGDDRLLVVYVTGFVAPTGITYDGAALTQELSVTNSPIISQLWYRKLGDGATSESGDIIASFSSSTTCTIGAASYSDVDQTTPFTSTNTGSGSGTAPSISLSTATPSHQLIGAVGTWSVSGAVTASHDGAGQSELFAVGPSNMDQSTFASDMPATGGTDVMSWTLNRSATYCVLGAELNSATDCDPTAASLPTAAATYTSSYATQDGTGWTHYCDGNGNLLLSLKLGGTGAIVPANGVSLNIGSPTAQFYSTGTGFITNENGAVFFNRSWNVSPSTQPSSNVPVRFYFTAAEYAAVNSGLTSNGLSVMSSESEALFYKATSGGAHAAISSLTTSNVIQLTNGSSSTTSWALGSHNSDHYAEFQVASFSGGGGGSSGGGLYFPVVLISFSGQHTAGANILEWITASEQNSSHFEVQRLIPGATFETVGQVSAVGNSTNFQSYSFTDNDPLTGATQYYRLKQLDLDGSFEYSPQIEIREELTFQVEVYPNPFGNQLEVRLQGLAEGQIHFDLFGPDGRLIRRINWMQNVSSLHILRLDSELPKGVYLYRITDQAGNARMGKLVKQ